MICTGGRGFIGTNLLKKVKGVPYDIMDGLDISEISDFVLESPAEVVHLAAEPGIPYSIEYPKHSYKVNNTGTFQVIGYRHLLGGKLILASSAAADNCTTPYAAFKRAGELYAKAYHETYGLEYTVLRFANVYGPHSMHKDSVVARMCKDAITTGEITVNGDCARDFIHVDDVVSAIIKSLDVSYNGILNVGSGVTLPVKMVAEIISRETGAIRFSYFTNPADGRLSVTAQIY